MENKFLDGAHGGFLIAYKNPRTGVYEPVSAKGHFLEDGKKSIPLRFYKSRGYAKKIIDMHVNLAFDDFVRIKRKPETINVKETAIKMYSQHRLSELRLFVLLSMLDEEGNNIFADEETVKRRCYEDFSLVVLKGDLYPDTEGEDDSY